MSFSGMDAAFEGFRITRQHPLAVLIWSAVFLVMSVLTSWAMAALSGAALADFMQVAMAGGTATAAQWGAVAPGYLAATAISLVINALIANAVARAAAGTGRAAAGFLSLGGRELLQVVNLFLWGLIVFVFYLLAAIATALVLGVIAFLAAMISPVLAATVPAFGIVIMVLALLLISARLVLAGPITAYEGRIGIGRSWAMTRGRTWALVGSLFIAFVFSLIVCILVGVIGAAILSGMAGGFDQLVPAITQASQSPGELSAFWIVYILFVALMSGLSSAIVFGVGANAYRQLTRSSDAI